MPSYARTEVVLGIMLETKEFRYQYWEEFP